MPDPPGKPGKPKATNWDKDFVDLEWTKPKDDGGAEITQYVVEKRDVVSSERDKKTELYYKISIRIYISQFLYSILL